MNNELNTDKNPVGIQHQITELTQTFDAISDQRKEELEALASKILKQLSDQGCSKLIFVCTHNSRRSQLAELWMEVACHHYGIDNIVTYSGGTEATAFNYRMVAALERYGITLDKSTSTDNPRYIPINYGNENDNKIMFSKKFDDAYNPSTDFIAVMVCDQADADCPFVPGAYARLSLPYKDPKASDDTDQEQTAYSDKVLEIGREMLYLTGFMKNQEKK